MCSMSSHHYTPITMTALPHWSDILITVQSSLSFTVRICRPIQMSKTFSCLFLLSFMLTLPLHEVMIPLFFCFSHFFFFSTNGSCPSLYFFSSPFYPTYLFLPFLFCWFVCFLTTASWNRSGWHPRSLTGQCTSHLPLPLLSFSDSRPLFPLPLLPYRLLFWLSFNTECNFIAPSVRSLTSSHLISPLHIPVFPLLSQLFTHSVFFPLHPLIFLSNNHLV